MALTILFAVCYPVAVGVTGLALLALRQRIRGPGYWPPVDPQLVPVEELALLAGGPRRAAATAVVRLYEAGAIAPSQATGLLAPVGLPPIGTHPISAGCYDLVRQAGHVDPLAVRRAVATSPATDATRRALVASGLLPSPASRRLLLGLRRLAVALAVLGVAAFLVSAVVDSPVSAVFGFLVPLTVFIALGTSPPHRRSGAALLAAARHRAWALAGGGLPGQRALAVAVFGPEALWSADPRLAAGLGVVPAAPRRGGSGGGHGYRGDSGCASAAGCGGGGGCGTGGDGGSSDSGSGDSGGSGGSGGGCGGGGGGD
ncbi:TIGR04222 domain-containing membrane protein [Frankia sp. CNm7]|uniref:TIGR04222 domain-containing membrane protein n=1 Tax=Frankia nepalensis TaxID=1836974 RepID=A0A937RFD9_9ACTN|nr:TIGR04222 domain-containing membrane protein [Frankia nepalensis]MBL7501456.1 TIGR04222 domain-containing membrane protein [Frankia nepalensis]MBL7513308.1 TIGR04222 domain-containing membrane protein [Frankia nepalensis]MBL7522956.1 TIGR04222 domain-containing membrane protein [Frankia nepalensis]MBL7626394.1 TIGR04222 domain-containing membrane protein [Frankia nepalensis]